MMKRRRRVSSIKLELLKKSKESALAAIQIFNNPNMLFKSESYIVLMIIAWTYMLHAFYRDKKIEYRYFEKKNKRKKFDKTKHGAFKFWELERCLNEKKCPIDNDTKNNLRFLIGLRHEIEHQMTTRIDDLMSAKFQACCLNYNDYMKKLFGNNNSIERNLSISLQFSSINEDQKDLLQEHIDLPKNILSYIDYFDRSLNESEYSHPRYAYRVLFVPKTANRKGQADRVIEFVKSDSPLAEQLNREYAIIKETERTKYLPNQIVEKMHQLGYEKFRLYDHTELWKSRDAKNTKYNYGVTVANKQWLWYESWFEEVKKYCEQNSNKFKL